MQPHHHSSSGEPPPQSFPLPVDADQKATVFRPLSLSQPHMLAFHLAWLNLFSCFFSTFSIPPLLPLIRCDLRLSPSDIAAGSAASFLGSILSRLLMGPTCHLIGPRLASASLSLLTSPAILATAFATTPRALILTRFLLGFSLANFVSNQFWMTSMFSPSIVGLANGVAAGWANVGSGLAQLIMPLIYTLLLNLHVSSSFAWRIAFVVPTIFQVTTALLVLAFGQDVPSGKHVRCSSSQKREHVLMRVLLNGLCDYRGWVLGLMYGFSFGVELTVDNMIAQYFYDRFEVNLEIAGMIAASFGMANLFSRPMGGVVSDYMGKRFGMRGRLWGLWVVQTLAGVLCVLLGRLNSLWTSILVVCAFSVFVQAASGLIFGVVPFVSTRSLGVISGMTGSGGTIGAVVTQMLLFSGTQFSKQTSISLMGILMILCTLPVTLLYFPQWGGMFCGPSSHHDSPQETYPLLA